MPPTTARRTALGIAALASAVGLVVALALTDGQLFLPYPRPYVP